MNAEALLAALKYSTLKLARTLRVLGLSLLFAAATGATALAVVFPLWFFATRHTRGYTCFVLLSILALLLAAGIRALVRSARLQGGIPAALRRTLLPRLIRLAVFLFFTFSLYWIVVLYARGRAAAATAAAVVYLLLAVSITYFRRRNT